MTKRLKTVRQAMELTIHHHTPPGPDLAVKGEDWTLEAYLDSLPAGFATALRAEIAKGTLAVSLVPEGQGKVRARRSKAAPSA